MVHIDLGHPGYVQRQLAIPAECLQQVDLEKPQLPVRDDQEVATATRRVEKPERGKLCVKCFEGFAASAVAPFRKTLEFGAKVVEKQRFYYLQDVPLGRVVGSLRPALRLVHDRLEQRSEDRR